MKKVLTILVLILGVWFSSSLREENKVTEAIEFQSEAFTISDYVEKTREFRAVWVATVYNLNMPLHQNETQYKDAFKAVVAQIKKYNMNAMIFQVRPLNDAFYESDYAPFSRYLAGSEGNNPGWDAMGWMVNYAKSQGVEFHAWLNPYRVSNSALSKEAYLSTLANNNFAKQNPDYVVAGKPNDSGVYPYILDPGRPEVKTYIRNVVSELINKYDVDGIHFDDYFYPYSGIYDSEDQTTYNLYNPKGLSRADWRRENVNDVVRGVMEDVTAYNEANGKLIRFGISPFGIWKNKSSDPLGSETNGMQSYSAQYADSKKWVEEGWLHYINPQVYWNIAHTLAPYDKVVSWWANVTRGTGVDLIIGHGIHNGNSWSAFEIENQLIFNHQYPEIKGSAFYSYSYLNTTNVNNVIKDLWKNMPLSQWDYSTVESPNVVFTGTKEGSVYKSNVTVTASATNDIYYRLGNSEWVKYTEPVVLSTQGTYSLYFKAVTPTGEESLIDGYSIEINKENNDVPNITVVGEMRGTSYVVGAQAVITANNMDNLYVAVNHGNIGTYQKYTGPIVLDDLGASGRYYIRTKTITSEGVESAEKTLSVTVVADCFEKPVISLSGTGSLGYYQSLTLQLTGETQLEYKINDGTYQTYSGQLTFDQAGDYTVYYRNNDGCKVEYNETFTIDTEAPVKPVALLDGTLEGDFYVTDTYLTLSHDEENVKLYYRYYDAFNVTPTAWTLYEEPVKFSKNTLFTVDYYAVDLAMNQSERGQTKFKMNLKPVEDNLYVVRDGNNVNYRGTNTPILLPTSYTEKEQEVRAVWVSTVSNIDLERLTTIDAYKTQLTTMLDVVKQNNFNTIFFQTRPMNDSFYPSDYAPFSRYITGVEGNDPGFDILEFVLTEAHQRGIEVHAWLNPYRVSTGTADKLTQLSLLSDQNFAKQNPDLVIADKQGKLILNPGEPQVRAYIGNIVSELISKYDVDGVHFDDYFYSYGGMYDTEDQLTYSKYNPLGLIRADWRRDNVNKLVSSINDIVKEHNEKNQDFIKFGISPFGIWKNGGVDGSNTNGMSSYSAQYADTKKWVDEGWLDYIMPQLYWEFNHSVAPFADLVDWWANVTREAGVDLIIGHGFYRFTDNTWDDENELIEQLRYISQYDNIIGSSFFTYNTLVSSDLEVTQTLKRLNNIYWTTQSGFPWQSNVTPGGTDPVCGDDQILEDGKCVTKPIDCENGSVVGGVCVPNETEEPKIESENQSVSLIIISSAIGVTVVSGLLFLFFKKRK